MRASSIQYCFHYLRHAGAGVTAHTHTGCELVYYSSGAGDVCYGSEEVLAFSRGTISLTYPGTPHGESWAEDTDVWCIIFACGEDDRLPEGVYHDRNGDIFPLIQALFREQQENRWGREEISLGYLEIILRLMARADSTLSQRRPAAGDRLDSVFYYIQDYYNTDIAFDELALSIGYSYDRFRHLFKARYNISPKRLVLSKRMDMAKQLLRESDEKIETIARACGFGTVSQFNVIFKKYRGMTPREYRNMDRENEQI